MASIWREKMLGYLFLGIFCSSKLTISLEQELRPLKPARFSVRSSRKTVSYE